MIAFVDLAAQQERIRADLNRRIADVLSHGRYILGPEVAELEERLAAYVGVRNCLTCANGTDALQIALMAIGVGPGDEVITPSFSYFATAETVAVLGAKPVFADVDPETCLVNVKDIEARITERTRAIIPVSLYGQCADMSAINSIAERHRLTVIEDAAQSFGATQNGQKSCSLSRIACTSFFPSKPLGCYGDGGAVFTNDDSLAPILRQIARHGQERRYHHVRIGINSRLDTIQAAILLAKLDVFDDEVVRRDKAARLYDEHLSGLDLQLPAVHPGNTSVWAQYTVQCDNRNSLAEQLKRAGIPTTVHYPLPLHRQPAFAVDAVYLDSERLANQVLSLPMHADLEPSDIAMIADAVRTSLQQQHV
ncbi:DegT/DnrJ/EryC1/StrS family aminotransferase [Henriciella barbarensis]|uniref:DegT/DnrJ/EryC1/StrS family aminotransferase n=1 Tax=Henriciella barbarensis TaxID=86342 RepID=A0A399QNK2_9PROT|nr:DegT/DnrJ/EryC1/StrS family aminotransferase [Henriciella barbarensis]RIJ20468.1 DegT/DnrJ/EryC1/StrS family aminotransferase [Henriciella barbarensis]